MGKPVKTWNILFPLETIDQVKARAEEIGVTPAGLVRAAVGLYLHKDNGAATILVGDQSFMRGVERAADIVKSEVRHPQFPSGQTFGERLADRIIERVNEDLKKNEGTVD